jgi:hypothetical protein
MCLTPVFTRRQDSVAGGSVSSRYWRCDLSNSKTLRDSSGLFDFIHLQFPFSECHEHSECVIGCRWNLSDMIGLDNDQSSSRRIG